jgi:aminoglycoside phosphotransferase
VAIVQAAIPGASVTRRPFAYATSFRIEELDVTGPGVTRSCFVAKHLGRGALSTQARWAKSPDLVSSAREVTVYRDLLSWAGLGTPAFVGGSYDDRAGVLVIERVDGSPLTEIGDFSAWMAAATWLARMHTRLGTLVEQVPKCLIRYEEPLLDTLARRGLDLAARNRLGSTDDRKSLGRKLERALESFRRRPATVVHGDLFPSNVVVDGRRVAVVDWELAGVGPALRDLATLVSGRWTNARRRALALAYRTEAALVGPVEDLETFEADLDLARLHLALCWLGSSPQWVPPVEHRHDWFGEARHLAWRIERLAA